MNQSEKIEALKETIIELRERYKLVYEMYKGAQVKMFTFMGAGFGLLTYLFTNTNEVALFKLPDEEYGKILFSIALLLILWSLFKLFIAMRGVYWEYPLHVVKLKDIEQTHTKLQFYLYIRNDYLRAVDAVQKTYDLVFKSINEASLMLAVGGILVVLIKIFSQQKGVL
jgi:hypothetical protein